MPFIVLLITLFALQPAWATISFEPTQDGAGAVVRAADGSVFLKSSEAVFASGNARMRMVIDHGRFAAPQFEQPLPGRSHYFTGARKEQWRTNVPHYGQVRFSGVLPGVDLVYYSRDGQLEYDFVVAPRTEVGAIRLTFEGATSVRREKRNLVVQGTDGRLLRHRRPAVYQVAKSGARERVRAEWRLTDKFSAEVVVGRYDRNRPLVIDPVVEFASWIGRTGQDAASAIAVDAAGNAWIAGETNSTDLATSGAYQTARALPTDAFLAKVAPSGAILALTYYGGSKSDTGLSVAVDGNGDAYLCGVTSSPDLPVPTAALETFGGGEHDVFVAKFESSGARLLWATYLGGGSSDWAGSIAADTSGNAWVTGWTRSSNFPVVAALQGGTAGGGGDAFITRVAAGGGRFTYSTYFGSEGRDEGSGIAVDAEGHVHVAGHTTSSRLPLMRAAQSRPGGGGDAFYLKLNPARNEVLVATYLGGSATDYGVRVGTDASGNGYVAGYSQSGDYPSTRGAFQTTPGGETDIVVTRINGLTGALDYSTFIGGQGNDWPGGLAVDPSGSVYVGGWSNSPDYPVRTPAQGAHAGGDRTNGGFDAVATRLTPSGSAAVYSTFYGGPGEDRAYGIAIDRSGRAWLAGTTSSRTLPSSTGAFSVGSFGEEDAFVVRLSADRAAAFVSAAPSAIDMKVRFGEEAIQETLQLRASSGSIPFTVTADVPWIVPAQAAGTAPGSLNVTIQAIQLPLGMHRANITLRTDSDVVVVPFTISVTPAPAITSITPSRVSAGSAATPVTVAGSGFSAEDAIEVNGVRLTTAFVDRNTLRGTLPANLLLVESTLNIAVAGQVFRSTPFPLQVTAPQPILAAAGVVNAASWKAGPVAPGQLIVLGGSGFGADPLMQNQPDAAGRYGSALGNVRVLFNDQPVPLLWVRSGQVAAQVPYAVSGSPTARVIVENRGVAGAPVVVEVQPASPGLFTASGAGTGQAAALNEDGTTNSSRMPARRGTTVVLYATGEGLGDPASTEGTVVSFESVPRPVLPVDVFIGSVRATIAYAGAVPGTIAGLMQINARIPGDAPTGDDVPVVLHVGSHASPSGVTLAIR